jgi:hypothetical protein
MKRLLALTFTALALTACGGGGDLAERDPLGAQACESLAEAFENKDDTDAAIAGSMNSGEAALKATTQSIKDATIDLGGDTAADPDAMVKACRAEGVDMPDVP